MQRYEAAYQIVSMELTKQEAKLVLLRREISDIDRLLKQKETCYERQHRD